MKKFGLLGYPLGHSLSPFIHSRFFQLCGIGEIAEYEYKLYEVSPGELSLKGSDIKQLNGFNVTIPYKTEIIPYLARLDSSAQRYNSVNCVNFEGNEYVGYNTDVYGFLKSIEELGADLSAKVLLLGCGGTGRMMAIEAISAGADLTLAIRRSPTSEKSAAALSRELNEIAGKSGGKVKVTYTDSLNVVNHYDLLLNSTPCGMKPNVDEIPVVAEILYKVKHLFDAVYNPTPTKLISEAAKRGTKTLGGMSMLVHQAAKSQTIWNGMQIDKQITDTVISEAIQKL